MLANNPFIMITSSGNEKVVDRIEEKVELQMQINEALKNGNIMLLTGDPGVGKSTLINTVTKNMERSSNVDIIRETFTPSIYNRLRSLNITSLKKLLIVLDDFNNIELLDKNSQTKVLQLMSEISEKAGLLLVENRKQGVDKEFQRLHIDTVRFEIRGLEKSDLRQLLIDRLNTVRKTPQNSIDPFTEEEFEKVYKKARGNPRIALLICSTLYDRKETSVI